MKVEVIISVGPDELMRYYDLGEQLTHVFNALEGTAIGSAARDALFSQITRINYEMDEITSDIMFDLRDTYRRDNPCYKQLNEWLQETSR